MEDTEYTPQDHIHRLPGALASHTSYNPMSMAQHEPTDYTYSTNLPPGVEFAAMNLLPYEMVNVSIHKQRWMQYEYERKLRNPPHILQGLDIDYWEARSKYPLLVPRRQDFQTWDDYVHASRDFSMELHLLQMRAAAARTKDHPKIRHYLDMIFKDNLFEKSLQTLGTLAAGYYGMPDVGFALGIGGSLGQYQYDFSKLKSQRKSHRICKSLGCGQIAFPTSRTSKTKNT